MTRQRYSRRTLLKTAASAAAGAAALPYLIPSTALGDDAKAPPSERITLAHIGVGAAGRDLFRGFRQCETAQSVAVADCYANRREVIAKECGGKAYADFREILADPKIDAVVVATPDHWHVPIANAAAKAKKHAYVEKPLAVSIEQDLACRKLFQENKLAFQYGTQQRSMAHCRFGCELVRSGKIGTLKRIEVACYDGAAGGSKKGARAAGLRFRVVDRACPESSLFARPLRAVRHVLDLRLLDRLSRRMGRASAGHHGLGERLRSGRPL